MVVFGRQAETVAQYMKKGRPMFVEGRITTRSWEGKEDGKKQYRTEIVVENFQFGADGGRGSTPSTSGAQASSGEESQASSSAEEIKYPDEEINPEDIPF